MNFFRFLISKVFLKNLGLALLIGITLLFVILLWLRIYTHHGRSIAVPDMTGLTLQEVEDVCSSRDLRYQVFDSIYSSQIPRGTVARQHPEGNTRVKKNRKVFLTMNAVNLELVEMPQLVGLSFRQARLAIENSGLLQGKISHRPDFAKNNVLQQMSGDTVIKAGAEVPRGTVIDLVLGMGLSQKTTRIPDLIGQDLEQASGTISDYYLNLGAVSFDEGLETAEDSAAAFVWRQYPEYSEYKRINMGLEMDLWLTLDSTRLPDPMPDEQR